METQITNTADRSALNFHEEQILIQCRNQAYSICETGKLLKQIKDGGEYKERGFETFKYYMDDVCGKTFPFGASQGYKYIRVFESYGPRLSEFAGASLEVLDILRDLPLDEADKLAESGEISTMTAAEAKALKEELKKANEQLALFEDSAKKDAEKEKLQNEKLKKEKDKSKELLTQIEKLKSDIKELESKPIETNVISEPTEEQKKEILEEAEKEISRLKEEVESSKGKAVADEQLIEFRFRFDEVQEKLKSFIAVLKGISDTEKKAKFKAAAIKFLELIREELDRI